MIRRILVGLGDARYAASATAMAIGIARSHSSQLTGITVLDTNRLTAVGAVPLGGGAAATELKEHMLGEARRVIDEAIATFTTMCDDAGIPYTVEQPEGDPYRCLADHARYHDLIVCGLGHLFEHGVIEEPPDELVWLVQSGVRPLIAVTREPAEIHRVLIAYSGSMESAKAMKRFVQLQLWPDALCRIVTFEHDEEKAERLLADAAAYCRAHGVDVDTEYRPESPVHGVLTYAERWDPDMIVLGNSGRSLLLRRIFGETMLYTVRNTNRPLFLAQ